MIFRRPHISRKHLLLGASTLAAILLAGVLAVSITHES